MMAVPVLSSGSHGKQSAGKKRKTVAGYLQQCGPSFNALPSTACEMNSQAYIRYESLECNADAFVSASQSKDVMSPYFLHTNRLDSEVHTDEAWAMQVAANSCGVFV